MDSNLNRQNHTVTFIYQHPTPTNEVGKDELLKEEHPPKKMWDSLLDIGLGTKSHSNDKMRFIYSSFMVEFLCLFIFILPCIITSNCRAEYPN